MSEFVENASFWLPAVMFFAAGVLVGHIAF